MSEEMSASEKKKEDWMNSKWRPAMGWLYMLVCFFDFVLAPVGWSILQAVNKGQVNVQWQPLTLQGAGLFHLAMGAVLGLAAYGRTQEKIAGANNGGISLPTTGVGTSYTPPPPIQTPVPTPAPSYSAPAPAPFVPPPMPAPVSTSVITGFGGKPAPIQPDQPVI